MSNEALSDCVRVHATKKGAAPVTLEKRARGKHVTLIRNVEGNAQALLNELKQARGAGGSLSATGDVEVQGDHCEAVIAWLLKMHVLVGMRKEVSTKPLAVVAKPRESTTATKPAAEPWPAIPTGKPSLLTPTVAAAAWPIPAKGHAPPQPQPSASRICPRDPSSFGSFERLMKSWLYWDHDYSRLRELYEEWLDVRGRSGSSGWLLNDEEPQHPQPSAPMHAPALSLDAALESVGMLSQPCGGRQSRAQRRQATAAKVMATQPHVYEPPLAQLAAWRPPSTVRPGIPPAGAARAQPLRPAQGQRRTGAAGSQLRRHCRARTALVGSDDDFSSEASDEQEALPSDTRLSLSSFWSPAAIAASATAAAAGTRRRQAGAEAGRGDASQEAQLRARRREELQGGLTEDEALALALRSSCAEQTRRSEPGDWEEVASSHSHSHRHTHRYADCEAEEDELARALALSLVAQGSGYNPAQPRRAHLLPQELWGELSEEEAFQLALALSVAAEADERDERLGEGELQAESASPPSRAVSPPPGLGAPPGFEPGLPPGLSAGASAGPPPLDDAAGGRAGFARWANAALSACTGHLENEALLEFLLAIRDPGEECAYLAESLGASQELVDGWLARRLALEF